MEYNKELVIVRGGGDISTETIQKIKRAGFKVVVLESEETNKYKKTCLLK